MRKLLLILSLLLTAVVVNAKPINWTDGTYTVTGGDADGQKQTLTVSGPGAFAAFVAATKDLPGPDPENKPLKDLGGAADRVNLVITGELNADDLAALNSTVSGCGNLATFKTLDLSGATFSIGDVSGMNLGGLEYLRLANSMTSAADVVEMGKLKQNNGNANLKMVGAYDPDNDNFDGDGKWAEVALYSYEADNVVPFITQMNMPTSGNPTIVPREIRMAGEYGEKDLVSNGATGTPNFGYGTSAIWDFTGAHFSNCTIPASGIDQETGQTKASYYNYNDPFCDGALTAPTTSSNSFYYFSQYTTAVVDIKLPDNNMTNLPYRCLKDLASSNAAGYKALYGNDAFNANKAETNCVPVETLVIPDSYTDLEEECGMWARIRHLVIGSGMKRIHGGAFLKCDFLEDLDFAAGLADCYIGDRAFNECKSMKHIALSEGIVSLGNGCFWNSQHLESIRLPQSLINMGNNCFNNCLALNSITIPENVEKIGQNAFTLCPFTDLYLTTTDPAKIPLVWSCGTNFNAFDGKCTFHHGHLDGWEGGVDAYQADIDGKMTWEQATPFYYMNWNGMPVLHYPSQLAEKVRGQISSTYSMKSKADEDGKQYGLPLRVDMAKRDNIPGADLGSSGTGKYTQDGWAQFMLMKEIASGPGSEIYQKEYDDVWYTMCFPFDLTDEQLAAAFNETFNIVDFSGVEVVEKEDNDGESMKLILHFNNVALTDYKDTDGKHYKRKMNGNEVFREKDETSGFYYNVYLDDNNQEYHHVSTSSQLTSNKTKTFAPGSSMSDAQNNFNSTKKAYMIDGILATAGHPYMIHPAIGVVAGQPKQRCTFAGIEWLPQGISLAGWKKAFEDNSRTIDLGVKKTEVELPDSNYTHPGYAGYEGQTYTFIGNHNDYQVEGAPEAPTIANGRLRDYPTKPTKEAYPTEPTKDPYPTEPVAVPEPTITLADFEAQNKPAVVTDPGITWTEADETLYGKLTSPNDWELVWFGEETITANYNDGSTQWQKWSGKKHLFQGIAGVPDPYADEQGCFNKCKETFNNKAKVAAYQQYLVDLEAYNEAYAELSEEWDAFNAFDPAAFANEHSQWEQDCQDIDDAYDAAVVQWEQDCQDIDDAYDAAIEQWQSNCADVDTYNDGVYAAWEVEVAAYRRQIPEHAYFLGRKAGQLPKYYREVAAEEYPAPSSRTGGFWPQFTAVIIPNTAAINGIEKGISRAQAGSKGFDMLFNEDFEGTYIDKDDDDVITAIENAKKEGADVKYVDIVVSINGQVVRRGSTSLEGLPSGMYIINGKKYFVK